MFLRLSVKPWWLWFPQHEDPSLQYRRHCGLEVPWVIYTCCQEKLRHSEEFDIDFQRTIMVLLKKHKELVLYLGSVQSS